jgi:ribosome maturation factor RimP
MKREELTQFLGKKVKITSVFGNNSEPIFYSGILKQVGEESVTIIDKFNMVVAISLDSIKKMEEIE